MPKKKGKFVLPPGAMAINDLPDLGDVVCGKVRTFSSGKSENSKNTEEVVKDGNGDPDLF